MQLSQQKLNELLNNKNKPHKNNGIEKKPIEVAAERLAEIIIAQIELRRNKNCTKASQ